jgi:hypothetical protein
MSSGLLGLVLLLRTVQKDPGYGEADTDALSAPDDPIPPSVKNAGIFGCQTFVPDYWMRQARHPLLPVRLNGINVKISFSSKFIPF